MKEHKWFDKIGKRTERKIGEERMGNWMGRWQVG